MLYVLDSVLKLLDFDLTFCINFCINLTLKELS